MIILSCALKLAEDRDATLLFCGTSIPLFVPIDADAHFIFFRCVLGSACVPYFGVRRSLYVPFPSSSSQSLRTILLKLILA